MERTVPLTNWAGAKKGEIQGWISFTTNEAGLNGA